MKTLPLTEEAWATELEADRRVLRYGDLPQDDERRNAKQLTGLLRRLRRLVLGALWGTR